VIRTISIPERLARRIAARLSLGNRPVAPDERPVEVDRGEAHPPQ
jgi:hypothetical protein